MEVLLALAEKSVREQWQGPGYYYCGLQSVKNPADRGFNVEGTSPLLSIVVEEQVVFSQVLTQKMNHGYEYFGVFQKARELEICDISVGYDASDRLYIAITHKDVNEEVAVHTTWADQNTVLGIFSKQALFSAVWLLENRENPDIGFLGSVFGEELANAAKEMAARSTNEVQEPRNASDPYGAPSAPAGWFPDPTRRHQYRYWDSAQWTSTVADNGVTGVDPV